jgi:SpoVK/Ycf46/Vps4 family AAA+-type ATPase
MKLTVRLSNLDLFLVADLFPGLAPVRSSKQDQIHASIVSTLLALMDGMDGRGESSPKVNSHWSL